MLTSEGREARIGLELDCIQCDRKTIPPGYEPYRRTPVFDQETVPKGLLERHTTKPGIWARIHVTRGSIDYLLHAPFHSRERLDPDAPGIVLPEVEHHLETAGPVAFYLEFWRRGRQD